MKLKTIYLKNFRCYKDEVCIEFDDLTTFVGKNDIGKSTILEGLEIFFNNDLVKLNHLTQISMETTMSLLHVILAIYLQN